VEVKPVDQIVVSGPSPPLEIRAVIEGAAATSRPMRCTDCGTFSGSLADLEVVGLAAGLN
jgi:hypothetical protein